MARRATRLVARYAHEQLGLRRIALIHAVANPASRPVAMASSFALEGTLRAALDHGDGVLWDFHLHSGWPRTRGTRCPWLCRPGGRRDSRATGSCCGPGASTTATPCARPRHTH